MTDGSFPSASGGSGSGGGGFAAAYTVPVAGSQKAPAAAPTAISFGAALTATPYGSVIPTLYGRAVILGTPLWSSKVKKTVATGGTFNTVDFAITFGYLGPKLDVADRGIFRYVWVNGTLVYSVKDDGTVTKSPGLDVTFYGLNDQPPGVLPNPLMEADHPGATPDYKGHVYVVFKDFQLDTTGGVFPNVIADVQTRSDDAYNITQFLADLGEECGVKDQFNCYSTDKLGITGAALNQSVKMTDVVAQLCALFRLNVVDTLGFSQPDATIDKSESDPSWAFVGRPDAYTDTFVLHEKDLLPISSGDPRRLSLSRQAVSDVPAIMYLDYIDFDNQGQIGTNSARRTKFPVKGTETISQVNISAPVVMTATEAGYWITRSLYGITSAGILVNFSSGIKTLAIEPGDVGVIVRDSGDAIRIMITAVTLNGDLSISFESYTVVSVLDYAAPSGTSNRIPLIAPPTIPPPYPRQTVDTGDHSGDGDGSNALDIDLYFVWNSLLFSDDNTDGTTVPYYVIASSNGDLYNTDTLVKVNIPTTTVPIVGIADSTLLDPGAARFQRDDGPTGLLVRFVGTAPTVPWTDTDEAGRNGTNAVLVGQNRYGYELIYFRTLTVVDSTHVRLTGLLRGRRGTDAIIDTGEAAVGDNVIFMAVGIYTKLVLPASTISGEINYKLVPYNRGVGYPVHDDFTLGPNMAGSLTPWEPVNVHAVRSSGDIVITWNRRDRVANELHDGDPDTPMSEATEAYKLQIATVGGSVLRTVTPISQTYTYTAAQQATDSFTGVALDAYVSQTSAVVGDGWVHKATVQIED